MKTIGFFIVVAALWVWACDDTNTAPPQTAGAASASSEEPAKRPSESHPRQFSP